MSTKDPVASAIGLEGYATKTMGIGGVLKARVSDFRVEEISSAVALDPRGRFTVAKVTLTNWETNKFIGKLASQLKISRNRIFFSGTKDKRAITQQVFVIDSTKAKIDAVEISDAEIEIIGRTHQKIGFGHHKGNRFTIVVRGCSHENGKPMTEDDVINEIDHIKEKLAENIGQNLFPNWIGPQRFGAGRPVTAEVGKHVLLGNYQDAVMTYLSMEGISENDDVAAFRKMIREQGIVEKALELMPNWLNFERYILTHLLNNPEDWLGAFKKLPNNLQLMTIHAAQSVIFNRSLKMRIDSGYSISTPIIGDLVGRLDDKSQLSANSCVLVEERTLPRISRNCELGRLATTGPLPGSEIRTCGGKIGAIEEEAIRLSGLENCDWNNNEIQRLSTKGTRRALVTSFEELHYEIVPIADSDSLGDKWQSGPSENSRWHPEGACVRFRFNLPTGSYATTLLREFMQCPLTQL